MAQPAKTAPTGPVKPVVSKDYKYPSEDETFVRRLGSAVLTQWTSLPADVQDRLLAEAGQAWDREYNVPGLAAKLEAFVKRRR